MTDGRPRLSLRRSKSGAIEAEVSDKFWRSFPVRVRYRRTLTTNELTGGM
jgi:hypothetical protein